MRTRIIVLVAATVACAHGMSPTDGPLGIPNQPALVTVVPFVPLKSADSASAPDMSLVPIIAEMNGHRGVFSLDLGSSRTWVVKNFFTPAPTDVVDTVAEGGRLLHVQLRIGTLLDPFEDPYLQYMLSHPVGHPVNAEIEDAAAEDFRYAAGPLIGNIGLSALEPFETIVDYVHRQVVFIRLDAAGHRLVDVPAYTPAWSAPLVDLRTPQTPLYDHFWGVHVHWRNVTSDWLLDTGTEPNLIGADAWQLPVGVTITDSLAIAGRRFHASVLKVQDFSIPVNLLGSSFLSSLGAVGFNHRTHQFLVYR